MVKEEFLCTRNPFPSLPRPPTHRCWVSRETIAQRTRSREEEKQRGSLLKEPLRAGGDPSRVLTSGAEVGTPPSPHPALGCSSPFRKNLSRYAQQMSRAASPTHSLSEFAADIEGGKKKKIFRGRPGGLGFLQVGSNIEGRPGHTGMGVPRRPQVRFCPCCTLPLHLTQLIRLVQSGSLWELCLQTVLVS